MKRSTDRFLTTHTGSLPRPEDLIRMMYAKEEGVPVDPQALAARVRAAVAEVVKKQAEAGVDLINDGEMSKPSYATYIKDRLNGFGGTGNTFVYQDLAEYPALAKKVFGDPGRSRRKTPACNAPISVRDPQAVREDVDNLKAALAQVQAQRGLHERRLARRGVAVLPQRPLQGFRDLHLRHRRRDARRIRDRGQSRLRAAVRLPRPRHGPPHPVRRPRPEGVPQARHAAHRGAQSCGEATSRPNSCACTCAGATTKARTIATCRSPTSSTSCSRRSRTRSRSKAANPRHEHEWAVFETVKLPAGKVLIPGVIESKSNFIEHPEVIAQRIGRYAKLVGRENVIAGSRLRLRHLGRPGRGRSGCGVRQAQGDGGRRADRDASSSGTDGRTIRCELR